MQTYERKIIDMKLLCHVFIIVNIFLQLTLWVHSMNWCVCVCSCVYFFPSICMFSLRISLTHCVVSRSTSVIIITLALYFVWHAVISSPLDTFFCLFAHLFLIHVHFELKWCVHLCVCLYVCKCSFSISTTIRRLLKILYANIQQGKKNINVEHFFHALTYTHTNYPCHLWSMFHFAEQIFNVHCVCVRRFFRVSVLLLNLLS